MAIRINNEILLMFAVLTVAFTLSGCGHYVAVKSSASYSIKNNNKAEVTMTPRYSNLVSNIKSVALSAPSSCENKSAAAATGTAEGRGDVIKTLCGVEMAEIERALVRNGFTVYSWSFVRDAMSRSPNKTAIEAAKNLGAQVLFQVNSLERVEVSPSRDALIERSFYDSNYYGDFLKPAKLEESIIDDIKNFVAEDELKQLSTTRKLGAMLDINAVDSETGQTIWFYRMTNQNDTSSHILAKNLLYCNFFRCDKVDILNRDSHQSDSSNLRSEYVERISISARPNSEQDVVYFGLLREITADFVKHFSSGI